MHGCCGLVRAPTELERTQDMHTATLPKRVLLARTTPPPSLDLRPPSDKPMTAPRGRWANRCSQPYAHEESAREVTRPLRARGPKTVDDDTQRSASLTWHRTSEHGRRLMDQTGQGAFHRVCLSMFVCDGCVYIQPGCRSCFPGSRIVHLLQRTKVARGTKAHRAHG